MMKNAEDRYQSAYGLKADLEECLRQWEVNGQIDPFPLGRHDVLDRFFIPQKLYGREREIETVLSTFERVSQGASEMMLVSGYAGVGKSALVQEVYKPMTRQQGYFISGKFDQLKRDIPYAALIGAFRSLVGQLLTETEAEIASWHEKLLTVLGPNGQVLIDVIPEVELIVGPPPEVPDLPPTETQNRFNLVFQNFIKVFTQPEHPVVIFLDDLQWADGASLKLIQTLMMAAESHHLFLIGAYRDNEVSPAHPLTLTLDELGKAGATVNHLPLSPLALPHVIQLTVDAFNCPPETAKPLAELVLAKTNGNPFFMNEFLKSLYTEGLLSFDLQRGSWQWDIAQIQGRDITDNVVELMAGKVQQMPKETQHALKLAACIGNRFDLKTLAIVSEKSLQQTASDLWEGMTEGLIFPLSDAYKLMEVDVEGLENLVTADYKFVHDQVQRAVYSLIPEEEKQRTHLRVGQLLLQNLPPDAREERLFEVVNQLNGGRSFITTQAERDELAQLNLLAGRKAKDSAAYQAAFNYLKIGLELLDGGDNWQRQYDLSLEFHQEAAEAAYLIGDLEAMEQLTETVLQRARTLLDKVKVYEVRIEAYTGRYKPQEAIKSGLQVLKLLGVSFPEQPGPQDIMAAVQETQSALAGRTPEDLIGLPKMTDPIQLAVMRVLGSIFVSVFIGAPELLPLTVCKQVNLSLKHGNIEESIFAYVNYAVLLGAILEDFDTSSRFGRLALSLLEQLNAKAFKARTYLMLGGYVRHWKEHIRETLPSLLEGYQSGLETGDFGFGVNCLVGHSVSSYLTGVELAEVEREMTKRAQVLTQLGQDTYLNWHKIYWQAVRNWLGRSENPCRLIGKAYDEEQMMPLHQKANDQTSIFNVHFNKALLCYRFGAFQQAVENSDKAEAGNQAGAVFSPIVNLYNSLSRLAVFPEASESEQQAILEKVADNQEKLKTWAEHAPMNYLHKFYLVEAERARVLGNDNEARDSYDRAIDSAREQEYLNEESLAYELAARFYLAKGQTRLARYYMRDAHYAYRRWGAVTKVKDLEGRYPQLLAQATIGPLQAILTPSTITTEQQRATSSLDLTSVLKASQTISGEIALGGLLEKLMQILIENAGAQKGFLILPKDGGFVIEAEASVDKEDVIVLQSISVETSPELSAAIVNYVARTKANIVLDDATHEGMFTQDVYITQNRPRSILCMPLINQGKLTGILYLENNLTTGAFTPERLEVLNLFSAQAAISIENARLYADLQTSEKKYRTRFEDSRDLIFISTPDGQILDINPAGSELLECTREEIMKMNAANFYANPEDRLRFRQEIERYHSVRDFEVKSRRKDGAEIDCLITATLRTAPEGTTLGYQGIIRDVTEQKRAEVERLRLTAIEQELNIARDTQTRLLPPTRPDWTEPEVICYLMPAREVGGDLYAYHAFAPSPELSGRYAVTVGDASGKGMPAALMMGISLASFQSMVGQGLAPGELLMRLSKALASYTRTTRQNCAMVYVEICHTRAEEQVAYTLRAANAGCVTPLVKRVDGAVEWVDIGGLPLGTGFRAALGYQAVQLPLSKGDLVILTSDGIPEALNASDEIFGFDRLEEAVRSGPQHSAEGMMNHLKAEVTTFVSGAEQSDDMTIVVVKV